MQSTSIPKRKLPKLRKHEPSASACLWFAVLGCGFTPHNKRCPRVLPFQIQSYLWLSQPYQTIKYDMPPTGLLEADEAVCCAFRQHWRVMLNHMPRAYLTRFTKVHATHTIERPAMSHAIATTGIGLDFLASQAIDHLDLCNSLIPCREKCINSHTANINQASNSHTRVGDSARSLWTCSRRRGKCLDVAGR